MRKLIISSFLALIIQCGIFVSPISAQTNIAYDKDDRIFKLSFGANIGIATKKSPFNYTLGFALQTQYYLSQELALTASGGYTRLLTKDTSQQKDYDFIPFIVGFKIFPINQFYLHGLFGAGFPIQNGSKISFVFGGGFGYEFNNRIDLAVKYEGYKQQHNSSTYQPLNGQFSLKLAYNL